MKWSHARYAAAAVVTALAFLTSGCAPKRPPTNLQASMSEVIAAQAQRFWDVSNRATNDQDQPDPTRLSEQDWMALIGASEKLAAEAALYSANHEIAVAPGGAKILNEGQDGASTGAQVQALIDADREDFARHAKRLEDISKAALAGARQKDAKVIVDVGGKLDAVCEDCHVKYWYPQEAAARQAAN